MHAEGLVSGADELVAVTAKKKCESRSRSFAMR